MPDKSISRFLDISAQEVGENETDSDSELEDGMSRFVVRKSRLTSSQDRRFVLDDTEEETLGDQMSAEGIDLTHRQVPMWDVGDDAEALANLAKRFQKRRRREDSDTEDHDFDKKFTDATRIYYMPVPVSRLSRAGLASVSPHSTGWEGARSRDGASAAHA